MKKPDYNLTLQLYRVLFQFLELAIRLVQVSPILIGSFPPNREELSNKIGMYRGILRPVCLTAKKSSNSNELIILKSDTMQRLQTSLTVRLNHE